MNLIFISSPQLEFAVERKELCYLVLTDPYLRQYFDAFIFENLPANQRNPERNYRDMVEQSAIYLGLLGESYGTPDEDGVSATEREFAFASELGKDRIVYLKELDLGAQQEREMANLIARVKQEVTCNTFGSLDALKWKVMRSLLFWQQNQSAS